MQTDIILTTLNSTYQHTSFGLRYLFANLGEYQNKTQILEFTLQREPRDIVEQILQHSPRIVGVSVYIWNAQESLELVSVLKRVAPEIKIVLGGPEVTHESETQKICQIADLTVKGESDFLFRDLCHDYLTNNIWPEGKYLSGTLPDIKQIASPYKFYSDEDIKNRILYVEISRGCPYRCEYCLSSLDKSVRTFDLDVFLADMDQLIQRGARQFKFIDRTFNLTPSVCTRVLQFFLDRIDLGLFLHFEMVPDRLPNEIRELIKKFPAGALQFEIGIQTWNPEVAKLVSRRNDFVKVAENFKFLSQETGVHTHADLIVGLPGEDIASFGRGFDALAELKPDEIQVGILKRLKGAPIARHDKEWEMVYQDTPPFQILRTKSVNYESMQVMTRFSKYWDLYANSGNFKNLMTLIKDIAAKRDDASFFNEFFEFNAFLSKRFTQSYGIALVNLVEAAYVYLISVKMLDEEHARQVLIEDYCVEGKRDLPRFFKYAGQTPATNGGDAKSVLPKRQQRHLQKPQETC
jgi:radical SAM superfamily enzyme YgiQ (UPF0313 family)